MKKKVVAILTLFILTLICAIGAVACNNHEHNFSTEWTMTDTHHYYECACGEKRSFSEHEFDSGRVSLEPTQTETGEKTFTCLMCGKVKTEEIPALGSNPSQPSDPSHQHEYNSVVTEPKCGEKGYTTYTCDCGDSYVSDYVNALEHQFINFVYNNDATCLIDGTETALCERNCGYVQRRHKANTKLEHDYGTWNEEVPASSTSTGTLGHYKCSSCERFFDEEYKQITNVTIPKLEYVTIYERVDENGKKDENGDYVLFGSYPQTDVTATMSATLNPVAGLPDTNDGWVSYGYYIDNEVVDFMWYIDVVLETEEYRGVYFNQYRPQQLGGFDGDEESSYQDDNGYTVNNVYWFKYEPLMWRILDETTGLLLCESVIDAQEYHLSSDNYKTNREDYLGNTASVYANNYQYSTIRGWLNTTFYQTAFSQLEQSLIKTTDVDNSARSTNPNDNATAFNGGVNTYACDNTLDKVFLLSQQEVTNSAYGFNSDPTVYDAARRKIATGYAKCQGVWVTKQTSVNEGIGKSDWQLRSPYYERPYSVYSAMGLGISDWSGQIYCLDGVVPVIQLDFENNRHTHSFAVDYTRTDTHHYKACICGEKVSYGAHVWDNGTQTKDPNCTEMGEKTFVCTVCTKTKIENIPVKHDFETKYSNNSAYHYYKCEHCSETTEKIAHTFVSGVCVCGREESKVIETYLRVDKDGTPNETGNYVLFGSYPQTDVTETMGSTLNAIAGLPSTNDEWIDYGYYSGYNFSTNVQLKEPYMWYIDVEAGGEKYRGVYFTKYRTTITSVGVGTEGYDSNVDNNGFIINTVYWFIYEPVKWRILSEENKVATLLCEMILDAQSYQSEYKQVYSSGTYTYYTTQNNAPSGTYANNYEYSTIRSWLNDTFYNTAFTSLQKELMQQVTVDNSASTTRIPYNQYACNNTQDYVYLLSYKDVHKTEYGFIDYDTADENREKIATDYSRCQGVYQFGSGWYLRSPHEAGSDRVCSIGAEGTTGSNNLGAYTYGRSLGIVPAVQIALS